MVNTLTGRSVDEKELRLVQDLAVGLPVGSPLAVLLQGLVSASRRGVDVTMLEGDRPMTPNEAAAVLGMSRPHLLKLLDAGVIEFHRVGSHRRIHISDVLDYIDRRERAGADVAHALGTREHDRRAVRDAAATFTDEELRELGML